MASPLKVFYRPSMSVPSYGRSPSSDKPRQVIEDWQSRSLPVEIVSEFASLTMRDLETAHEGRFVREILEGIIANGHGNFRRDTTMACLETGVSLVAAALDAIESQSVTCSPTSGFHHAHYNWCGAFCTFNSLIIAAQAVERKHQARVGIIDFDYHYGDGTQDIIDKLDLDIPHLSSNILALDQQWVNDQVDRMNCELILYQAGADQHIDDPLGGCFTTDELLLRDQNVFQACKDQGASVCWNLAGGYQTEFERVLEIHRNTLLACREAFYG